MHAIILVYSFITALLQLLSKHMRIVIKLKAILGSQLNMYLSVELVKCEMVKPVFEIQLLLRIQRRELSLYRHRMFEVQLESLLPSILFPAKAPRTGGEEGFVGNATVSQAPQRHWFESRLHCSQSSSLRVHLKKGILERCHCVWNGETGSNPNFQNPCLSLLFVLMGIAQVLQLSFSCFLQYQFKSSLPKVKILRSTLHFLFFT